MRHGANREIIWAVISKYVPLDNPSHDAMMAAISLLPISNQAPDAKIETQSEASVIPEVEVFLFTLINSTLLRHNLNESAAQYSLILIKRIQTFNRRSLDIFSSKAYFYFSLAFEKISKLENIRSILLILMRTTCLHRDEMGHAVLLNLLLRNYLEYNLIEQAQTLVSKSTFPENASNNQFCRYLYYTGRIQSIQLEYSQAYLSLNMASRKIPQGTAKGFSLTIKKLTILVQLLMGDIPERASFNTVPEYRAPLKPYLALTQAVRAGDLQEFSSVVAQYSNIFKADKNFNLIQRLGHNVIKTGLRKISVSYSRISLDDIAIKLKLPSGTAAEYVCAKAIK